MIKYQYRCVNCGGEFSESEVLYLCPKCSISVDNNLPPKGILEVIYDYKSIHKAHKGNLVQHCISTDYIDVLPINNALSLPFLKVGNTPLYKTNVLYRKQLPYHIYFKDDSQNPTFSFKDRASALVSAWAKEHNINKICAASTGNAGSSIAGICASQGQKAFVLVPEKAPKAKLTQIIMYGATIIPVKGSYDNAFDLSIEASKKYGWYNRNTAFNPFTIEGKKTVSFELFRQLSFKVPDRIFVPVGDGVIISGVYKGFYDLLKLGIINKMPIVVAVQARSSSNLVNNLQKKVFKSSGSDTIADSIAVDIPRNFYMAEKYLYEYNGESILVDDNEIIAASKILAANYGLFSEPAAAAAFAGLIAYHNKELINENSHNIVLLTGNGLKDLNAVESTLNIPEAIEPQINMIQKLIDKL